MVAFNNTFTSPHFEALEVVQGVVIISRNKQLNSINISHLHKVNELTRIEKNNDHIECFISIDPLTFHEPGCRSRGNIVPGVASSGGDLIFVTNMAKRECFVKIVVPVLVGIGICCP